MTVSSNYFSSNRRDATYFRARGKDFARSGYNFGPTEVRNYMRAVAEVGQNGDCYCDS